MLTETWNWLWEKHDQVKDMFRFFVKPFQEQDGENRKKSSHLSNTGSDGNDGNHKRSYTPLQLVGLILGPVFFLLTLFFFSPEGLSKEGLAILASTIWMAVWWMTEAIPIPATALLPIILFPLTGGMDIGLTTSSYGNETIFLFMGGFMIAIAMERWNLHKRIAISIISIMGTSTDRIILGFMAATGFLSMWISNTATAMMMVPIGMAIIYQVSEALQHNPDADTSKENFGFGKALMLGIAYSASIGGMATLIGTPPNAILAGTINEMYGIEISFAQWMIFGVPFAWIFIFVSWFYLVKVAFPMKYKELPGGRGIIAEEKKKLGTASYEEKIVLTIFIIAALAWISRTFILDPILPGMNDAIIAILAALILFLIPTRSVKGDHLLNWDSAVKLPWGILLLFGGGLAIAAGFTSSGLSKWIGTQLTALQGVGLLVVVIAVTTLVIFLTEITSNTATATMMYPIMASLAFALDVHPLALMTAAGLAASCAFMLPVATPPNAVVFGSGYLRIPDMAKAGFYLNIVGIILVTLTAYFLMPLVFGIDLNMFPDEYK
ncbi:MAG TPA: DASS family sodium-coupled anion symporter [Bacillus sp. (in: firmicutes)]|uniref:SLC13 family permease n=1 Tax=Bacillus litorisediminis TaxID=2922713 RepID=UPI001FB0119B|nr:DASS family sodium-coupled anion symporter [Bacillus litorisediminis]HWO78689.1 DASS family sodium-coupled anion symporter [Bacillus sp. (in: firmicutes)]